MNYRELPDDQLLQLIKADDEKAFKEVYCRYWKTVFDAAYRRLASKETAKELVQNLFLRLWENRHTTTIHNLYAYCMRAIRNSIINYIESAAVHQKYLQYVKETAGAEYQATSSMLTVHELSRAIENALHRLPEKTRHIFRLSRFHHWSIREIAASLNISEKAVEYHITQSLKTMRVYLKDYFMFL